MLGFGWYVWDERCPSGRRCVPPIYGNFKSTYNKVPENSPRKAGRDQPEAVSASWKARTPRENDVFIKVGSKVSKNNVMPLKTCSSRKQIRHYEDPGQCEPNNGSCNLPSCFTPPQSALLSQLSPECKNYNAQKKFYNVMWDPKIARGPTLVQFKEAQQAKWKRQVDSHQANLMREQMRRRRKKLKEEQYLETKSNPMRRIVYPPVTIRKEPLTSSSYALFLEEMKETTEMKNASQLTDADDSYGLSLGEDKKLFFSSGIPASVQTERNAVAKEIEKNEDWIASTMIAAIAEQAVLEVLEEEELEAMKGEQKRHELVLLCRKWRDQKASEWIEYLEQWNEHRMREILDQNSYLEAQQERIFVIGFSKNAITSCFQNTFKRMKQDGFISECGVSYEEIEELNASLEYQNEIEKKLELARKVVDSTLINAVVQRFSGHMFDDYGKPHGEWLHMRGRHESIDYDTDLQNYLKNRWTKRRGHETLADASVNSLYSEESLLDIFSEYKGFSKRTIMRGGGPTSQKFSSEVTHMIDNLISKHLFGQRTGKTIFFPEITTADEKSKVKHGEQRGSSNDFSMLYESTIRWSKVELDDQKNHHQNLQQKSFFSPGSTEGKRGPRLTTASSFHSKSVQDGTIVENRDGVGGRTGILQGKWEEADSNKLGESDGKSEERSRANLSSESRRQSQSSLYPI